MKTGSIRLLASVSAVAGIFLMQGCATSKGVKQPVEPVTTISTIPAPEPVVAPQPVVVEKVKPVPAPVVVEKAVLKPVPAMTTPYTVKSGDSLTEIAFKYGKRWQDVLAVNPDLSMQSKLRIGQTVHLPNPVDLAHPKIVRKPVKKPVEKKPEAPVVVKDTDVAAPAAATPAAGEATYTVKKNDSVSTIAAAHHVKRADLMQANNLTPSSVLQIGQKLVIPGKTDAAAVPADASAPAAVPVVAPMPVDAGAIPPPPVDVMPPPAAGAAPVAPVVSAVAPAAPAADAKTYTVKEDEDLYTVAIRWGVSPADLKAINNLSSSELQPGQVLKIPAGATATTP